MIDRIPTHNYPRDVSVGYSEDDRAAGLHEHTQTPGRTVMKDTKEFMVILNRSIRRASVRMRIGSLVTDTQVLNLYAHNSVESGAK